MSAIFLCFSVLLPIIFLHQYLQTSPRQAGYIDISVSVTSRILDCLNITPREPYNVSMLRKVSDNVTLTVLNSENMSSNGLDNVTMLNKIIGNLSRIIEREDKPIKAEDRKVELVCISPPSRSTTHDLLVMIISAPGNKYKRDCMRMRMRDRVAGIVRFIVGLAGQEGTDKAVVEEAEYYEDICIIHDIDSYSALATKVFSTLAGSLSMSYHYLVKLDDDVLLHPDGLARIQEEVLDKFREKNIIFGFPVHNHSVHRHGKYAVSARVFNDKKFPSFVLGPFYILTSVAVRNIVNEGLERTGSLPLEDVAITGVLRELSSVGIVSIKHHIIPSLDYVYSLIHFFSGDLEETARHLTEYSVVVCNHHNISQEEQDRIVHWIWNTVWNKSG